MLEPMKRKRYVSVWDAIEKTPAQAENLKLRSSLMLALKRQIEREGLSQTEAAKVFGVTQPRISDLMRGKIELFRHRHAREHARRRRSAGQVAGEEGGVAICLPGLSGYTERFPIFGQESRRPLQMASINLPSVPSNCAPAASASTAAATCLRR